MEPGHPTSDAPAALSGGAEAASALGQLYRLWRHADWADRTLLAALEAAAGPPEAVREYAHVIGAEETWLSRLERRAPECAVWPDPSLPALGALARSTRARYRDYLDALRPDDLPRLVAYTNSAGRSFESAVGDILLHVMLHGQYHRGRVNLMLRSAGAEPAPVDFIAFVRGAPAATRGPRTAGGAPATVVTYRPELRAAFESLNRQWIEEHFVVEPRDLAVFGDPEGEIRARGGEIFFVAVDGRAVGTCAMTPLGGDAYYLSKMAVDRAARGRGYGDLLLAAALRWARERGARSVELTSNTVLGPAIALYRKHGFVEVPLEGHEAGFERVNVRMACALAGEAGSGG